MGGIALSSGYCSQEVQAQPAKHAQPKREKQSCTGSERETDQRGQSQMERQDHAKAGPEREIQPQSSFPPKGKHLCYKFAKWIVKSLLVVRFQNRRSC